MSKRKTAAKGALLLWAGMAGHAMGAQETPQTLPAVTVSGTDSGGDEDNVVAHKATGATKTSTPLIETTQSVSVITQAQIASQAARNVPQALRYLAGAESEVSGADYRFDTIMLRGFAADEYLDGLRLPQVSYWSRPQWDPYLLERIEVVKGPSSVLYGQVNPGGLINLTSKKPTEEPVHEIYLTGGNYNQFGTGFDLSGPLDDQKQWLGRVAGTLFQTDTQVDHTRYKHYDIAPSLTWQPNDRTSLTLLAQLRRDPDGGFFNMLPVDGTLVNNPYGKISSHFYGGQPGTDSYERKQASVGYQFSHAFNDIWTFRQNLRYVSSTSDYQMVYPFGTATDAPAVHRYSMNLNETLSSFTVDNQAEADIATGAVGHKILMGVDYLHDSLHQNVGYGSASDLDYLDPDYSTPVALPGITARTRQTQSQTGFYLQDQAKWRQWVLNLGGRYDEASTITHNLVAASRSDENDYATTGRAGLLYHFDSGFAPYVSYSTSFVPASGTDYNGDAFKPTKGKQAEAGVKYQPNGLDALFTAAVYNLRQTNVLTADPDHADFSVQTGEIRSKGIELEGKVNVTPSWLVTASYALTDPEITRSNDGDEGNSPVGIARQSATLWSEYTLPGKLDGVTLGGGVRYVGTSYADTDNTLKVPAATVYDAMARYRLQQWQLALNVQNLTNKTYLASCQNNGCYYGLKRQYIATLSYQW
ncbi:TonB-dependent siderophore receptor [Acerihabitans sp. KWT182]|uniref:TonB-dependent siderophore receptor n=1 Tax=Acerihabitans sp. KWT182 TaxID=3157919 RepID=A0AAU7Q9L2_9GAMM